MAKQELLQALCLCPGVGQQREAAEWIADYLRVQGYRTETDSMGNVFSFTAEESADKPTVLLEAHMDQVGLVVTGRDEHGFLQVAPCGSVDNRILTGAEVTVYGDAAYPGVFCSVPPHLGGGELPAVGDRAVDVGMTADEAAAHIPVGSYVSYRPQYTPLLGRRVSATSLDDRSGVYAVLRCLEQLKGESLPCRPVAVFTVQEEVGLRGAGPAAFCTNPAASVSVDVSFAMAPSEKAEECGKLGDGPMIGVSPCLDWKLSEQLRQLAAAAEIPFQLECMAETTGTNADRIGVTAGGIPTALVSIPLRNMHTPVEVVDLDDVENTARLLAELMRHWGETV